MGLSHLEILSCGITVSSSYPEFLCPLTRLLTLSSFNDGEHVDFFKSSKSYEVCLSSCITMPVSSGGFSVFSSHYCHLPVLCPPLSGL